MKMRYPTRLNIQPAGAAILILFFFLVLCFQQTLKAQNVREHINIDKNWRFATADACLTGNDFGYGTSYFTYFAKAGYGDGPASPKFEDRIWQQVDLPHDWAVTLPFAKEASHSHGYKIIGWKYPENSIGWYRKTVFIPDTDLGKRISIQFNAVFRNSSVWVNGFFLGNEPSGYTSFEYDITDYLNYGGDNIITVRADASLEEGWFYEGAGIYSHVWLNKTDKTYVSPNGTFITSKIDGDNATLTISTKISNKHTAPVSVIVRQELLDESGKTVGTTDSKTLNAPVAGETEDVTEISLSHPKLWSIENPYLYTLVTKLISNGKVIDEYKTTTGIRSIYFDADNGFFLNGKHMKLKGHNVHLDHAGVGVAVPDELWEYRIKALKEFGSNAIRTSHNPVPPELLDICDRLGVLVLEENRLEGINDYHYDLLKRMIERDRNHPSIILWSLGNEEWTIEGNELGERITETMQSYAQTLDPSRRFTVAISGGCGKGSSVTIDIMGVNYLMQCGIDEYHSKFPDKPMVGTEESTSQGTRGVYTSDKANGHMAYTDRTSEGPSIETGWKFYDERPFLSGLFYWTGFDYRGEPNPLKWPAVASQFGILDMCGFPKDPYYYLKACWTDDNFVKIQPHWNWPGSEGKTIKVWAYSNCDEVELILNNKSLGKKKVIKNQHLEWDVTYKPGTLLAKAYKNGRLGATDKQETTTAPVSIKLTASKDTLLANGNSISVVNVEVLDAKGRVVPDAMNDISFTLSGEGKILGVGNGEPASHEEDQFLSQVSEIKIEKLCMKDAPKSDALPDLDYTSNWTAPFAQQTNYNETAPDSNTMRVIKGTFELKKIDNKTIITLYPKALCDNQSIYINDIKVFDPSQYKGIVPEIMLDHKYLKTGENVIVFTGSALRMQKRWDELNTQPGSLKMEIPAGTWKRKLFNGYAQIILQAKDKPGVISLKAESEGLAPATININAFLIK
jgi:beta-galactosidase